MLCYEARDGKLLWDTKVPPGPMRPGDIRGLGGEGFAGPTPVTDGKLVYCVFGSAVLAALDYQGKIVWRKEFSPWKSFDVIVGDYLYPTISAIAARVTGRITPRSQMIPAIKSAGVTSKAGL